MASNSEGAKCNVCNTYSRQINQLKCSFLLSCFLNQKFWTHFNPYYHSQKTVSPYVMTVTINVARWRTYTMNRIHNIPVKNYNDMLFSGWKQCLRCLRETWCKSHWLPSDFRLQKTVNCCKSVEHMLLPHVRVNAGLYCANTPLFVHGTQNIPRSSPNNSRTETWNSQTAIS